MKNKLIINILLVSMLLTSCNPGTVVPTAPLTVIPSGTPIPQFMLQQDAILFSGPGNVGYSTITDLSSGTQVSPLGTFGDFVKVETIDTQIGFVLKSAMANLPQTLPELSISEVPWEDLHLRYNFVADGGVFQNDQIKITDINGNGTSFGSGSILLDSAFRITMSLRLEKNAGEYASINLKGTPTVTEGDWWRGLKQLDIGANQRNTLQLCIHDGSSEQCNDDITLNTPTDQPFTLVFDDPQGKILHILNQDGKEIKKIDFTQLAGISLPGGLFPKRTLWLDTWVNPQANLYIDTFLAEEAPLGKATLGDIPDLSIWVDDYVHAYGGQVIINGLEMDAEQLTDAIRKDSAKYTQVKQVDGKAVAFLVVNDTPLAIQKTGEPWKKVYGRDIADALKIDFEFPALFSDIADPANREILANANKIDMSNDLDLAVVYKNFQSADWRKVLDNWDRIQTDINNGKIPTDLPFYWNQAEPVFLFAQSHNMKVRGTHLLAGGSSISDSILKGNFSKAELKKILEFTTSVTVLKYKGLVDEWDISDEQVVADINKGGNEAFGFWMREIGLLDATELVARTVKKIDHQAKLLVTEAFVVEEKLATQEPELRDHFFKYLEDLRARGVPFDGVDLENGVWVYNPPKPDFERQILEKIKAMGLYIAPPETVVVLTPDRLPFWYEPIQKTAVVTEPLQSQADVFREITQTYLDVGATGVGFGDVGDKWSFLNYLGAPDANPSLFDDDCLPKQSYYAVMKVLYDHLP